MSECEREMWDAAASVEQRSTVRAGYRVIEARFAGKCDACGGPVAKGDRIHYCRRHEIRVMCEECAGRANAGEELEQVTPARPSTRERKLARAERLRGWSESNGARAAERFGRVDAIAGMIPFGQPILVGHHSEGRARKDQDRIHSGMRAGVDLSRKAEQQASRADTIERQAAHAIYSDDVDAVERLEEKLAGLEAERDRRKDANATYRREHKAELGAMSGAYARSQAVPFPTYSITNLTGLIGTTRKRLEHLTREA